MPVDYIRYDILAQQALRGVVRRVLTDVAKNGLPGDHHFYISFKTTAPGVQISQRLRTEYPEQMTIVLQHQFWNLTVTDEGFEVGASFGGIPERVSIPFEAIVHFSDPSVQFGLQFEAIAPASEDQSSVPDASDVKTAKPERPALLQPSNSGSDADHSPAKSTPPAGTDNEAKPPPPSGGAEVVRLDRFRKK